MKSKNGQKKTGNQILPLQVDSNGCSMFAGDIHGLATANARPETASQSYRRRWRVGNRNS